STTLWAGSPQVKEPPQAKAPQLEPKPAAAIESKSPAAEQGRLEGRITAADTGKPVAGAKVRVFVLGVPDKDRNLEAVSDADGRYALTIPLGDCNIWGIQSPAGYYTQDPKTHEAIVTTRQDKTVVRDFVLQRGRLWRVELRGATSSANHRPMFSALPNPE